MYYLKLDQEAFLKSTSAWTINHLKGPSSKENSYKLYNGCRGYRLDILLISDGARG